MKKLRGPRLFGLRGSLRSNPAAQQFLTQRQTEAAEMAARGVPTREIANHMGITEGTLKVYISRVFQILGVQNRAQLAGVLFPERGVRLDLLTGADSGGTVRMGAFE